SQAPLLEQGIQVGLRVRVEEQQEMAAFFHISVNPFLFLGGHRSARTCYHKNSGMVRHGCLFKQAERADVVPLLEQDLSGGRQPCSLPIVETRLSMPFEKEHPFLAVLRDADQSSR